jgi:hypothetical protein
MKFTAGLLRLFRPMCGKSRTCREMRRRDFVLRPRSGHSPRFVVVETHGRSQAFRTSGGIAAVKHTT